MKFIGFCRQRFFQPMQHFVTVVNIYLHWLIFLKPLHQCHCFSIIFKQKGCVNSEGCELNSCTLEIKSFIGLQELMYNMHGDRRSPCLFPCFTLKHPVHHTTLRTIQLSYDPLNKWFTEIEFRRYEHLLQRIKSLLDTSCNKLFCSVKIFMWITSNMNKFSKNIEIFNYF